MAARGATVTGIDASEAAIRSATAHLALGDLAVDYVCTTAEEMAGQRPGDFDVVVCMELLEHVPQPASLVSACARLARPGGEVIFSTINRNPKAYLLAVIGAEYLLGLIPRGTHDYAKFIRPSELAAWSRTAELRLDELRGLSYNPLMRSSRLVDDVQVNYLARLRKAAAGD
jgi:2-polyprenyl-6-hydroxyphenyl methylase/3-demethylubiquinone-9 3-methyltransferase